MGQEEMQAFIVTMNKLIDTIQISHSQVLTGFTQLHAKLDAIKDEAHKELSDYRDEFFTHQKTCAELFSKLNAEAATRNAVEIERTERTRKEDQKNVNWGGIKTMIVGAIILALVILLLGNLFPNVKWR